jgi:hypothetical protein
MIVKVADPRQFYDDGRIYEEDAWLAPTFLYRTTRELILGIRNKRIQVAFISIVSLVDL